MPGGTSGDVARCELVAARRRCCTAEPSLEDVIGVPGLLVDVWAAGRHEPAARCTPSSPIAPSVSAAFARKPIWTPAMSTASVSSGSHDHGGTDRARRPPAEDAGRSGRGLGPERLARTADLLQVPVEAQVGCVDVEVARLAGTVGAVAVDDVRGNEGKGAGAEHPVAVGEGHRDRAVEHVEAVCVQPVHVRVGPSLTRAVARLRERQCSSASRMLGRTAPACR